MTRKCGSFGPGHDNYDGDGEHGGAGDDDDDEDDNDVCVRANMPILVIQGFWFWHSLWCFCKPSRAMAVLGDLSGSAGDCSGGSVDASSGNGGFGRSQEFFCWSYLW